MKIPACGNWIWQKGVDPAVLLPWFAGGTVCGGIEVKRNPRRVVYRVTAQDGRNYFAKLEHSACLLFRNKAKIEFEAGRMLRKAGIPCVEFAACGRRGRRRQMAVTDLHQSDGVGDGQPRAATGAAAGKNLAAILGGHTGTEAMHLGALALLGLISSDGRSHKYTLLILKVLLMK